MSEEIVTGRRTPHDKIACPKCGRIKPSWAIIDGRCREDMRDETRKELGLGQRPVLGWADIRAKRNQLLAASDWTQLDDAPRSVKDAWKDYRQKLRDLPSMFGEVKDVKWPTPPEE